MERRATAEVMVAFEELKKGVRLLRAGIEHRGPDPAELSVALGELLAALTQLQGAVAGVLKAGPLSNGTENNDKDR